MTCIHGMGRPVEACEACDLADALDVTERQLEVALAALGRIAFATPDNWWSTHVAAEALAAVDAVK